MLPGPAAPAVNTSTRSPAGPVDAGRKFPAVAVAVFGSVCSTVHVTVPPLGTLPAVRVDVAVPLLALADRVAESLGVAQVTRREAPPDAAVATVIVYRNVNVWLAVPFVIR